MTKLTNWQLHNDEANAGCCLTCGCTVYYREYYCSNCIAAAMKEMLKKNAAKGDSDSTKLLVEEDE